MVWYRSVDFRTPRSHPLNPLSWKSKRESANFSDISYLAYPIFPSKNITRQMTFSKFSLDFLAPMPHWWVLQFYI